MATTGRRRVWPRQLVAVVAIVLTSCSTVREPSAPPAAPVPAPSAPASPTAPAAPAEFTGVRWVRADFSELPGWADDRQLELWPALQRGCARPAPAWREFCARVALEPPADHVAARRFLQTWLQPWRLQTPDGRTEGLATGYFEPEIDATRERRDGYAVPLYAPPADLATRKPHFSRQELDTVPAALASLAGRELAWLNDPIDQMLLQIQGSGRLRLREPDGRVTAVRAAFAGHNGHPYRSPGRWLVEQGEIRPDAANWAAIRAWAAQKPERLPELMWSNPRVVFFRLEPLPDPSQGPRGAQGVPLTPMRSVAVDARAVPYGTSMWIATSDPVANTPLQRVVMAQDTGGAIVGAVRIDLFTGWGDAAWQLASRMKQPLRAWALWPRQQGLPPGVAGNGG